MAKQSEQATDITQPNTRQAKFPFINEIMTGIIPHRRNGNNKKDLYWTFDRVSLYQHEILNKRKSNTNDVFFLLSFFKRIHKI